MIDLEQLKADRDAGTDGPWEISHQNGDPEGSFHGIIGPVQTNSRGNQFTVYACQYVLPKDARRIARLPELEAAYIEAVAKLELEQAKVKILKGYTLGCECDGAYDSGCPICTKERLEEEAIALITAKPERDE